MASLYFDRQDYELLSLISRTIDQAGTEPGYRRAEPHPHGIVELADPAELRMASAVLYLLDTLAQGEEEERLRALRSLRDEVLASARTEMRRNTGRVLLQIMKDLVRAHGDEARRLRLAHDFRQAATGRPSVVRRLLRRYYLLEMPEDWSQEVFDHHVHDANTKGRKNATHLIMDAWLKGIRALTVVYYNYVTPEAARELVQAAEIMGVTIRIGLLFQASFRNKSVDFIWVPRGFAGSAAFLEFLAEPGVRQLMEEGHKASQWAEDRIREALDRWNRCDRLELAQSTGIAPNPLTQEDFTAFVGTGQASLVHLAEFVHRAVLPCLEHRAETLRSAMSSLSADSPEYKAIHEEMARLDTMTPDFFLEHFSARSKENSVCHSGDGSPDILRLSPLVLLDWLANLHSGNRIILNLADLDPEDVLNLLWDCQGHISHLELFNLKDWQEGKSRHLKAINELQIAINENGPRLAQIIRDMIRRLDSEQGLDGEEITADSSRDAGTEARKAALRVILRGIPVLRGFYRNNRLKTRIGTESTGRSGIGMGLAFPESLPPHARKELRRKSGGVRLRLPLFTELRERVTYSAGTARDESSLFTRLVRRIPGLRHFRRHRERDWVPVEDRTVVCENGECTPDTSHVGPDLGNIITLGGPGQTTTNGFLPGQNSTSEPKEPLYFNTILVNTIKVLTGFVPAMAAFLITQEIIWLAWLGAPLWFFITGLRNIVQAVLGGGGLRRSPLLRWNSYVSWSRLCDSLMYTGISVVLLELMVRRWLLQGVFGVTSGNNALLVFTVISLINGLYIAGHNYLRGLQREAIVGNLFRSVFAIPVSLVFNAAAAVLLPLFGVADPTALLLSSAAIISKIASDTVAGIIEGLADRNSNVRLRDLDYGETFGRMFDAYGQLELLFPEQGALEVLNRPRELLKNLGQNRTDLHRELITIALDLMYFWFYQPRAAYVLGRKIRDLSAGERLIFLRCQGVLTREREISQLFVDGLLGRGFARPLSFYLDRYQEYLESMEKLCLKAESEKRARMSNTSTQR